MYLGFKREPLRTHLIERINAKKEDGLIPKNKKITDNLLIDE